MIADKVKESVSTKDAAEQEIRQAFKRLVDVTMKHRDAWNRFVDSPGLSVQGEVSGLGFVASGGMFVPVTSATTISLAAPVASTAGLPLAVWNGSGGIVLLEPVGSTLNGASLGWVGPGLHVLYPDATNWFGGNTRAVEFVVAGTLEGTTTGAEGVNVTEAGSDLLTRMAILGAALQGTAFGGNPILSSGFSTNSFAPLTAGCSNTNSTVAAGAWFLLAHMFPPMISSGSVTVTAPDAATDLTLFALIVNGADQSRGFERVDTDGTGTSITSGTITTTRPGAIVIDFVANDTAADVGVAGPGQTEIANGAPSLSTVALYSSYKSMPIPGTTTMSWSGLTDATNKAGIAIVIEPAEGV